MANVNDVVRRFENGGILLIGADILLNIVPGSLKFKAPMRERVKYSDRGVQQNPLLGDDVNGTMSITVRGKFATNSAILSAWTKFFAEAGTTNPDNFDISIKVPDRRGATTGDIVVLNDCYLIDAPEWSSSGSGQGLDETTFNFEYPSLTAPTTY